MLNQKFKKKNLTLLALKLLWFLTQRLAEPSCPLLVPFFQHIPQNPCIAYGTFSRPGLFTCTSGVGGANCDWGGDGRFCDCASEAVDFAWPDQGCCRNKIVQNMF